MDKAVLFRDKVWQFALVDGSFIKGKVENVASVWDTNGVPIILCVNPGATIGSPVYIPFRSVLYYEEPGKL